MSRAAATLAEWSSRLEPTQADLELASRALVDTVAVAYAARTHPLRHLFDQLFHAGRWAALGHVLDYDDLHLPSTTHVSAVCVPVALASRGDARAYLAGAGVMARLGTALGWKHYSAGWHATCTAGAPAAAVAAAVAHGLSTEQIEVAIALAVPAAGGVQRAFGTAAKPLQVGFAADAGVRAARLAAQGATADPSALDEWIGLVGGDATGLSSDAERPAVPGGLAIKLYPCCYALQRPIAAVAELADRIRDDGAPGEVAPQAVTAIQVTTPASSLKPLIHSRPTTGLEGKFSLEYGIAAALLDRRPDMDSFTDAAVSRPDARRLMALVDVTPAEGGDGLLDGHVAIEIARTNGTALSSSLKLPPGAPDRPPTRDELGHKIAACAGPRAEEIEALTWESAASFLSRI